MKSGSLNLLEPSGPVQACNGISLPLSLLHCVMILSKRITEISLHFYMSPPPQLLRGPWKENCVYFLTQTGHKTYKEETTCPDLGVGWICTKKRKWTWDISLRKFFMTGGEILETLDIYLFTFYYNQLMHITKLNSVALVRTRTIPTERPPPVGEVNANFCG